MQIFLTILAGVVTFVCGQMAIKLLIDPVQSFKKTVAEIAYKLILHANRYVNPRSLDDEAQAEMCSDFRNLSSQLMSAHQLIPGYKFSAKLFGLPSEKDVVKASKNLIALHNGHEGRLANQGILNCYSAQRVREALRIYIPEGEYLDPEHEVVRAKNN
ncbi:MULTISPECIES: hypothetical protein [Marinobacter]|uniref:hypothetical protein n=1 Tax=Marinobacter TaxID=2742 RepID=UPI002356D4F1|nr:hypothetical protein [Marinobacter sp.]